MQPGDHVTVRFLAPERKPMTFDCRELLLPGEQGVFTVLPGHTPFLTTLAHGLVELHDLQEETHYLSVLGGFCEVKDGEVTVLADAFEPGTEIDLERAESARERAIRRIERPDDETDVGRAEAAIARANARIEAHRREGY